MSSLIRQPRRFDDHKQLALVKYTQYLASRQDVLKEVYAHKQTESGNPEQVEPADMSFRDTLIFQLPEQPLEEAAPARLTRLGRGENIRLPLVPRQSIQVVLSRHTFQLSHRQGVLFSDEQGNEFPLHTGRNVVGRHPESDVIVDSAYRDISRTHLMVDLHPDDTVTFTDLSSHGTFIPVEVFNTRLSD